MNPDGPATGGRDETLRLARGRGGGAGRASRGLIARGRRLPPGLRCLRFLLLLPLVLGCSEEPVLRSPPATLAGLPLDHRLSGEAALEAIRRLHDGDEIELASAWIAHYGRDVSAMLYVGIGGDRREAARTVARMRGRIADGGTPFVGIHEARLFGADVYVMTGGGQLHFLYPDGKQVIWLSADPAVACAALAEALGAEEGADGCGPAPP